MKRNQPLAQAALAVLVLSLSAGTLADTVEPIVEKDAEGNTTYRYPVTDKDLPGSGDQPFPCPSLGGRTALAIYFFKDGTINFSKKCPPNGSDVKPDPVPPKVKELTVELLKEDDDPCYRFRSGGSWYYRCW